MAFTKSNGTAVTPLGEIELLGFGDPLPKTRLPDVRSASSIYEGLKDADEDSSTNRARLDGMFDGTPPFDQGILQSTGQGSRTNLNFGEAQRLLDVDMSAFVDLYSSLDRLVNVWPMAGEPEARVAAADIIGEELTRLLRSDWPAFHSLYLRLCTEFVKHGVSVAYFPDAEQWKFRVTGLGDFLVPRQTPCCEDELEVAASRRSYLLHELYAFISDEKIAAKQGWNVGEVKRVLTQNVTNSATRRTGYRDWESLQRELKNSDLQSGMENTTVSVIHMWTREFDGSISLNLFAEDAPQEFLFTKQSMFPQADRAFVFFTYGVGNNGTLHAVRGKGQRIFAHIQTSNRLRCQMTDAAFLGGSVMLQPQSERALEKLSYTMFGPYSVLSPDVEVVTKAVPNLSQSMQPALDSVEQQLARNADPSSTYGDKASPYRNELQVEHDLNVASRLTGATLNLFYSSLSRLFRETVRRIVSPGNADQPLISEFYRRCEERGVPKEVIRSIDHGRTTAVRAIGAGSAANRLLALRELKQLSGDFDDVGRNNLTRDITTARVGRDLTDRYAPPTPAPRPTVEGKIALLENMAMASGSQIPVVSSELHGEHLRGHLPALQQLVAGISSGEIDPLQHLPHVKALHVHCSEHNRFLAVQPAAAADYAAANQMLQQSEEIIVNMERKIMAQQRQEAEAGAQQGAEGGDPGEPSPAQLKMELHNLTMELARSKANTEMEIKQAKAAQDRAIKDAAEAVKMANSR